MIEEHAKRHRVQRVTRVRLEIGRLSSIEKSAMAFAFDVVMQGTVAEGAELVMLDLPGKAMCYDCFEQVAINDRFDLCPLCGGDKLMPIASEDMRIKDLEVV